MEKKKKKKIVSNVLTHIHICMSTGECASSPLSWENRLRIAAEAAQGWS